MSPLPMIEAAAMPQSDVIDENTVFNFEWNIFQQSLDWYNMPTESWPSSESCASMASSPENISYFAPDQNAVQSPRSSRPLGKGLGKPLRVRKTSEVSRSRRQIQNRESQRCFRIRQRARLEELQKEVESLRERNKLLEENYADLNILYMDRFKEESVDESLDGLSAASLLTESELWGHYVPERNLSPSAEQLEEWGLRQAF